MVVLKQLRKAVSKRTGVSGFMSGKSKKTLVTDNEVESLPEEITVSANAKFAPTSSNVKPTPPLEMKPEDVPPNPNSTQSVHLTIKEGPKSEHEGCKGDDSIESKPQKFESTHDEEEFSYEECNDGGDKSAHGGSEVGCTEKQDTMTYEDNFLRERDDEIEAQVRDLDDITEAEPEDLEASLPKDPEQLKPNCLGDSEPEEIKKVNSEIFEQISLENQPTDSMWVETHENVESQDPEKVEQRHGEERARLGAIEVERTEAERVDQIQEHETSILKVIEVERTAERVKQLQGEEIARLEAIEVEHKEAEREEHFREEERVRLQAIEVEDKEAGRVQQVQEERTRPEALEVESQEAERVKHVQEETARLGTDDERKRLSALSPVEQLQDEERARLEAIENERLEGERGRRPQSSEDIKRIMGYWSIMTPPIAPRPLPEGCLLGSPRCGITSF